MRVSTLAGVALSCALHCEAHGWGPSAHGWGPEAHGWKSGHDAQNETNVIPSEAYIEVETDPTGVQWPWRVFKSDGNTPPNMTITKTGEPLSPGYVFMTPWPTDNETHQSGGFIMTTEGEMVFSVNISGMHNFRVQHYNDTPYLTFWNGLNAPFPQVGKGYGQVTFIDGDYKNFSLSPDLGINTLQEANPRWKGGQIDIHESQMTTRNTILVTAYNNSQYDLSSLNDTSDFWKTAWITDGYFYELDIATGQVLFEWRALDHVDQIPLNSSRQPLVSVIGNGTKANPWDWIHLNSVELLNIKGEDYYLVDARHTFSVMLVSAKDGRLVWKLDGENGGDFGPVPAKGQFRWQHDARAFNVTEDGLELRLFDNHNAELFNGTDQSKVVIFQLQTPPTKDVSPQLVRRIDHGSYGQKYYADSMGSYNLLSDGHELVGWGQVATSSEYDSTGKLLWEASFGQPGLVFSYRFYKNEWNGTPQSWDPSLVLEDGKAYVSWNGATEVEEWKVYTGGSTEQDLAYVGVAKKAGFETVFEVPGDAAYVQVGAVQCGEEIRKTQVIKA